MKDAGGGAASDWVADVCEDCVEAVNGKAKLSKHQQESHLT